MTQVRYVGVVIPARNEENAISACLTSVQAAANRLLKARREVVCQIVVVLDCCTDGTAAQVAAHGVDAVISSAGRVGCARRAGVSAVLERSRDSGIPNSAVWLANTDADSTVPVDWLTTQMRIAATGVDLVIGTVTPAALAPDLDRSWRQGHALVEGHPHVHGANLGIRASTYLQADGFGPLSVDEDHDIVAKVQGLTDRWVATHRASVRTSGRTESRVDGGFATYLARLDAKDSSCA